MPLVGLSDYQRILVLARRNALERLRSTDERLITALRDAEAALTQRILRSDDSLSRRWWEARRTAVRDLAETLALSLSETLRTETERTASETARLRQNASRLLVEQNALPGMNLAQMTGDFSTVPASVMESYAKRSDVYGLRLSPRKWAEGVTDTVARLTTRAIASGQSAVSLSRELRGFLLGAEGFAPEELADLRRIRGTERRTLAFSVGAHARMTARTEIGNAYWEASVRSASLSPVVGGIRWNLSASHFKRSGRAGWDMCDVFASSNLYGLGAGVYPVESAPIPPHPNCLCHTTDVLRDPSEWETPRPQGTYRDEISIEGLPARLRDGFRLFAGLDSDVETAPRRLLEDYTRSSGFPRLQAVTPHFVRAQIGKFHAISTSVFDRETAS